MGRVITFVDGSTQTILSKDEVPGIVKEKLSEDLGKILGKMLDNTETDIPDETSVIEGVKTIIEKAKEPGMSKKKIIEELSNLIKAENKE